MHLGSLLKPERGAAVRVGEHALSFVELDVLSARVAALLHSRGITAGDRVGSMLVGVIEQETIHYGVLRAGAVLVPIDVTAEAADVAAHLQGTGARLVFAWHESLDAAEAGARAAGADYVVVHPASFAALLDEMPLGADGVRAPQPSDVAVLLWTPNETVAVTHGQLWDQQEEQAC